MLWLLGAQWLFDVQWCFAAQCLFDVQRLVDMLWLFGALAKHTFAFLLPAIFLIPFCLSHSAHSL